MAHVKVSIEYSSPCPFPQRYRTVSYTSNPDWYTFTHLAEKDRTREDRKEERAKGEGISRRIPEDVGVYEVRAAFEVDKRKRLYIGSSYKGDEQESRVEDKENRKKQEKGLRRRIHYLISGNEKLHSHSAELIQLAQEYLDIHANEFPGMRATDLLLVRWSVCSEPILLEVFLHLQYDPKYCDKNSFPMEYELMSFD